MAGFTGFSFSNSSIPSSSSPFTSFPPFAASSASSGSTSSSSSSSSTSCNSGSTSNVPSFSFGNSSSTPSFGSSAPTDEATIKKIAEAVELLEKLAKNGVFPQEKLEEIKKELGKMYPNLFNKKMQNNPQKPESYSPYSFSSSFANSNLFQQQLQQQLQQQQQQREEIIKQYELIHQQKQQQQLELIKQYELIHQQQLNYHIQAARQEYMKVYQTTAAGLSPYNIYGNYPVSYNNYLSTNNGNTTGDALNMVLEMMGQSNNSAGGLMNNILGSTGLGSDGFSSLSFLGSLLGGFGL